MEIARNKINWHLEGGGCDLIEGTIHTLVWIKKLQNTSMRISGNATEIRT
jgi:hypothetical protein